MHRKQCIVQQCSATGEHTVDSEVHCIIIYATLLEQLIFFPIFHKGTQYSFYPDTRRAQCEPFVPNCALAKANPSYVSCSIIYLK